MEAFLPNKSAVEKNSWQPATEADSALMEDMCDENNPRPYHIINTNIILSNSPKVDYRNNVGLVHNFWRVYFYQVITLQKLNEQWL